MPERLGQVIQEVVRHLVDGRFRELEMLTGGVRLTAGEMADAIRGYGRTLVHPPDEALRLVEITKREGATERSWHVVAPLWTREEGRSDLSLELGLTEGPDGIKVEVDDIHVLWRPNAPADYECLKWVVFSQLGSCRTHGKKDRQ